MSRSFAFAPRLLKAPAAAHYLGISESKLLTTGIPRRVSEGNKLFDIRDLDAWADELPYEGAANCRANSTNSAEVDSLFGVGAPN
ncbi:helix-turn-helix transcriptional regulator [Rhodovulum adriaticum]|uniref:DNA-binding protein n=1 Tax=Rhodovulum adriaticum TaxID=35804 RepID=A0A4R2NH20_RHOAD|nr:DNA-binding protein [Rhodovulum adriaticum]TCP20693.1 hypothetical protein EV656_11841 [Rhodovulum adriaticum]